MCNTDHMMLSLKGKIGKKPPSKQGAKVLCATAWSRIWGRKKEGLSKGKVCSWGEQKAKRWMAKKGSVEEKWQVMKLALCEAANSTLGTSLRRKADLFEESAGVLRPLLEKGRGAYLKWLDTGNERERKRFAEVRRIFRRAVRDVKNS